MYILEANTGAGKSTFLKLLEKHNSTILAGYEPVADWQKPVDGQSILTNFFADPQRWAYPMETYAMLSRVRQHMIDQENDHPKRIIERSIYSGHYCFALNSYKSGFMNALEWSMYCSWFNFLIPGKCKPPRGFIYLRTDPKVALARVKKRARSGELIELDYLENLHDYHERFLMRKEDILPELKNVPVLVLEINQDFENNPDYFATLATQVEEFLERTTLSSSTCTSELSGCSNTVFCKPE